MRLRILKHASRKEKIMAKAKESAKKKEAPVFKEAFYDVISRPVITEKATAASEHHKVIFRVRVDVTKAQVKEAVEGLFKVDVTAVNTINVQGKKKTFKGRPGKRKDFKKAIVTLKPGQSIDLSSGVA
jgi:large subunit ribosomal protein L23